MSDSTGPPIDCCSEDAFLGGMLRLRQPQTGYRAAIDPVFLAAAVQTRAGERILDVGAGHGAAALCLARRVAGCRVSGIEIQPALAVIANKNARLNSLADRVEITCGDIMRSAPFDHAGRFDHVMANPPFLDPARDCLPTSEGGRTARAEGAFGLRDWLAFMLRMTRPGGYVTLIHRADRLDETLLTLQGRAGGSVVFPLWPKPGVAAKRIILRARKGARTPLKLAAGMVLHRPDGSFSAEADAILRGAALDIDSVQV